jgi:hypothetical protein
MRFCDVWVEQCEAAKQIEAGFGTQQALEYLIGEKFLNFLQNELRRSADDLLLVAQARAWLLGEVE